MSERPETSAAIEAARAGLALARARVDAERVRAKDGIDIVTGADIAAEREIRRVLAERCPQIPVVGEEAGGEPSARGAYWLVDPICGTRNYASHLPAYCTNVALIEDGVATIAVVGDGGSGELSFAERGGGAFGLRPEGRVRLRASDGTVLGVELGGKPPYRHTGIGPLFAGLCGDGRYYVRMLGTTLGLAKVASGDLAGLLLLTETPDALHTAAGCLLAEEAGALVCDRRGDAWTLDTTTLVLSATAAIRDAFLRYVAG